MLDDEDKTKLKGKADMFTKRTIRQRQSVTSVDTAAEALALSIGEKPAWIWRICPSSPVKVRRTSSTS